ncbi:hypothetical protein [Parablautia muri]|uniref:Uncharacterized protein n=1 Tax=Parablautia muri TaxID=2320879 RepID=A0A9X5GVT3_9FIRM|nr:hypothetical protein [Parablautia muri]NBJ95487.1 hypothetical protein [Parablautia muri]
MNKTNTTESSLNMIKSVCAERDHKERDRLRANRIEMDKREEAERERVQHSSNLLNSYIEKAMARENQQKEKHNQILQNIHEDGVQRKSEEAYRTKEMVSAVNKGFRNAEKNEEDSKSWDVFLDRNRRLMDKGIESVKRERSKTYFSWWVSRVG